LWCFAKLFVISCIAIPLLINNRQITCHAEHDSCSAFCDFDSQVVCYEEATPTGNGQVVCTSPNTESIASIGMTVDRTCSATVYASCFNISYFIILALYCLNFGCQLFLSLRYDSFDPLQDMIGLALRFDLKSPDALTTLMHPSLCLTALLEAGALYAVLSIDNSRVTCSYLHHSPSGPLPDALWISILVMEICSPVAIHALGMLLGTVRVECKRPEETVPPPTGAQILLACVRLDLLVSASIIRGMQAVTWPVAILSYLSIWKRNQHDQDQDKNHSMGLGLLVMDVRTDGEFHVERRYAMSSQGQDPDRWVLLTVAHKLCSRYTVQYSFVKLVASIVISLALNAGYSYCGNQAGYISAEICPMDCSAHCVFESVQHHNDDAMYPTSRIHSCSPSEGLSAVHNACFCDNWLMSDMLVILFNTLHFVLQCYYLIRYNNFDPQQNQIDCVQSYTFVGDNILLFLTHPAISLLSVLEAAVLVVSWNSVVQQLGVVCSSPDPDSTSSDDHTSAVLFALFMTLIEVYKANMTVATNALKEKRYGWAAFCLLRMDLFVFYASTLFLQMFLFPFSIVGYIVSKYMRWRHGGSGSGSVSVSVSGYTGLGGGDSSEDEKTVGDAAAPTVTYTASGGACTCTCTSGGDVGLDQALLGAQTHITEDI
jgi:hypothetical protein